MFELIYHSHVGELEVAVDRARCIIAANYSPEHTDLSAEVRERRWAHRPLLLTGSFDEALATLSESILAARRSGSAFDEATSLVYRVATLHAADRLAEAEEAFSLIEALSPTECGTSVVKSTAVWRAYVMLGLGRLKEFGSALDEAERNVRYSPLNRQQVAFDSLRVLQQLLVGVKPEMTRLGRLHAAWNSVRGITWADTPYVALCAATLAAGDADDLRELTTSYRSSRREQFPITGALTRPFFDAVSACQIDPAIARQSLSLDSLSRLTTQDN